MWSAFRLFTYSVLCVMYSFCAFATRSIDVARKREEKNNAPKRNTPLSGRCAARVLFLRFAILFWTQAYSFATI